MEGGVKTPGGRGWGVRSGGGGGSGGTGPGSGRLRLVGMETGGS